jgi:hypothetical protein
MSCLIVLSFTPVLHPALPPCGRADDERTLRGMGRPRVRTYTVRVSASRLEAALHFAEVLLAHAAILVPARVAAVLLAAGMAPAAAAAVIALLRALRVLPRTCVLGTELAPAGPPVLAAVDVLAGVAHGHTTFVNDDGE